jgi:hypothetical protein
VVQNLTFVVLCERLEIRQLARTVWHTQDDMGFVSISQLKKPAEGITPQRDGKGRAGQDTRSVSTAIPLSLPL